MAFPTITNIYQYFNYIALSKFFASLSRYFFFPPGCSTHSFTSRNMVSQSTTVPRSCLAYCVHNRNTALLIYWGEEEKAYAGAAAHTRCVLLISWHRALPGPRDKSKAFCLSLPKRSSFKVCLISLYIILFLKKFPNVNEKIHTDIVNGHFTISKWASIPPLALITCKAIYNTD